MTHPKMKKKIFQATKEDDPIHSSSKGIDLHVKPLLI